MLAVACYVAQGFAFDHRCVAPCAIQAWDLARQGVLLQHSLPRSEWLSGEHFACPRYIQLTVAFAYSSDGISTSS